MDQKITIGLITFLVLKELWDIVKRSIFQKDDELKENTKATIMNTMAIDSLKNDLGRLSRLPSDVNEAHSKIRVLEERLKNLEN